MLLLAEIVVVTCDCGTLPLNTHANATDAWKFAADHVALTGKCTPAMFKDTVPAALAPRA
jgi:hypothetical protein